MKILAVDDDPDILEILTLMTSRLGFLEVSTALSGEIALDILNGGEHVFDLILLDISMPGMDGIELCSLVRTIPAYVNTPIVMLTAMSERSYIDRAFSAGATDYATKPFDIVEINARLNMAKEVVVARQEAAAVRSTRVAPYASHVDKDVFDLSDEIFLEDTKYIIRSRELRNYLTQLSNAGLGGTQVFAIKIDSINTIYRRASFDEFTYALTEAADAIDEILRENSYLMAYNGKGVFIVVSNKATLESSIRLEADIQDVLDDKCTEFDNGESLDIEISIGNPIRPNKSRTQGARRTFDRAIARAENRALKKENTSRSPNIRLVGR